jgi:ferredoxin
MAELYLNGERFELEDGSLIKDVCETGGVLFACNEGLCGSCVIKIKEGIKNLSAMTEREIDFFGEGSDERLACQCKIEHGVVIIEY